MPPPFMLLLPLLLPLLAMGLGVLVCEHVLDLVVINERFFAESFDKRKDALG